jgi:hypothetical protein
MTPGQKLWIKALFFAVGTGAYIGLYVWFLVETFGASKGHPPTIPGGYETLGITLSAAVGGYLAKILGVPYPGGDGIFVRPSLPSTPQSVIGMLIFLAVLAYLAIGVVSGIADAKVDDELVPAVIAAQWKILLGLIVATFVAVLGDQTG